MKYIKTFNEKKKESKEKDQEIKFDADSMVSDKEEVGFKSELEELKEKDEKKIKAEVRSGEKDVTKGSIKK